MQGHGCCPRQGTQEQVSSAPTGETLLLHIATSLDPAGCGLKEIVTSHSSTGSWVDVKGSSPEQVRMLTQSTRIPRLRMSAVATALAQRKELTQPSTFTTTRLGASSSAGLVAPASGSRCCLGALGVWSHVSL